MSRHICRRSGPQRRLIAIFALPASRSDAAPVAVGIIVACACRDIQVLQLRCWLAARAASRLCFQSTSPAFEPRSALESSHKTWSLSDDVVLCSRGVGSPFLHICCGSERIAAATWRSYGICGGPAPLLSVRNGWRCDPLAQLHNCSTHGCNAARTPVVLYGPFSSISCTVCVRMAGCIKCESLRPSW